MTQQLMRGGFIVVLLYLLSGCAGVAVNTQQPGFLVPAGTRVQVSEDLELRNGARISIQEGRILEFSQVQIMRPYCQFKVIRPPQEMRDPLVIKQGDFYVTQSYRRFNYAALDRLDVAISFLDDENRTLSTVMELSSDDQPNVDVLVCARWGTMRLDGYLTLEEIRAALGKVVRLEFPG